LVWWEGLVRVGVVMVRVWDGRRMEGEVRIIRWCKCRIAGNMQKNARKTGPKKWPRGPPGRGVLRFSIGGIQESRSFLGQKRAKNQKMCRLRG